MKKYVNGEYVEMTAEEIAEFQKPIEVSPEEQIEDLQQQLDKADYKIIKCMEYFLVGKPLPYDVFALHEERDPMRDKINELEEKIAEL